MARPIWKGMISFGLVSVPVALYPAEESNQLSFSMLDKRDFSPVGYKRYNKTTGREVPWNDIVKGYEYEKGSYVELDDADLDKLPLHSSKAIDIAGFIEDAELPGELYYQSAYYLEPEKSAAKPYALVLRTQHWKQGFDRGSRY